MSFQMDLWKVWAGVFKLSFKGKVEVQIPGGSKVEVQLPVPDLTLPSGRKLTLGVLFTLLASTLGIGRQGFGFGQTDNVNVGSSGPVLEQRVSREAEPSEVIQMLKVIQLEMKSMNSRLEHFAEKFDKQLSELTQENTCLRRKVNSLERDLGVRNINSSSGYSYRIEEEVNNSWTETEKGVREFLMNSAEYVSQGTQNY